MIFSGMAYRHRAARTVSLQGAAAFETERTFPGTGDDSRLFVGDNVCAALSGQNIRSWPRYRAGIRVGSDREDFPEFQWARRQGRSMHQHRRDQSFDADLMEKCVKCTQALNALLRVPVMTGSKPICLCVSLIFDGAL